MNYLSSLLSLILVIVGGTFVSVDSSLDGIVPTWKNLHEIEISYDSAFPKGAAPANGFSWYRHISVATSNNLLEKDKEGWFEVSLAETTHAKKFGFTIIDHFMGERDSEFMVYASANGVIGCYERMYNEDYVYHANVGTYGIEDKLRLTRQKDGYFVLSKQTKGSNDYVELLRSTYKQSQAMRCFLQFGQAKTTKFTAMQCSFPVDTQAKLPRRHGLKEAKPLEWEAHNFIKPGKETLGGIQSIASTDGLTIPIHSTTKIAKGEDFKLEFMSYQPEVLSERTSQGIGLIKGENSKVSIYKHLDYLLVHDQYSNVSLYEKPSNAVNNKKVKELGKYGYYHPKIRWGIERKGDVISYYFIDHQKYQKVHTSTEKYNGPLTIAAYTYSSEARFDEVFKIRRSEISGPSVQINDLVTTTIGIEVTSNNLKIDPKVGSEFLIMFDSLDLYTGDGYFQMTPLNGLSIGFIDGNSKPTANTLSNYFISGFQFIDKEFRELQNGKVTKKRPLSILDISEVSLHQKKSQIKVFLKYLNGNIEEAFTMNLDKRFQNSKLAISIIGVKDQKNIKYKNGFSRFQSIYEAKLIDLKHAEMAKIYNKVKKDPEIKKLKVNFRGGNKNAYFEQFVAVRAYDAYYLQEIVEEPLEIRLASSNAIIVPRASIVEGRPHMDDLEENKVEGSERRDGHKFCHDVREVGFKEFEDFGAVANNLNLNGHKKLYPGAVISGNSLAEFNQFNTVNNQNRSTMMIRVGDAPTLGDTIDLEDIDDPQLAVFNAVEQLRVNNPTLYDNEIKHSYDLTEIRDSSHLNLTLGAFIELKDAELDTIFANLTIDNHKYMYALKIMEYVDVSITPDYYFRNNVFTDESTPMYNDLIVSSVKLGRTVVAIYMTEEKINDISAGLSARVEEGITGLLASQTGAQVIGSAAPGAGNAVGGATGIAASLAFERAGIDAFFNSRSSLTENNFIWFCSTDCSQPPTNSIEDASWIEDWWEDNPFIPSEDGIGSLAGFELSFMADGTEESPHNLVAKVNLDLSSTREVCDAVGNKFRLDVKALDSRTFDFDHWISLYGIVKFYFKNSYTQEILPIYDHEGLRYPNDKIVVWSKTCDDVHTVEGDKEKGIEGSIESLSNAPKLITIDYSDERHDSEETIMYIEVINMAYNEYDSDCGLCCANALSGCFPWNCDECWDPDGCLGQIGISNVGIYLTDFFRKDHTRVLHDVYDLGLAPSEFSITNASDPENKFWEFKSGNDSDKVTNNNTGIDLKFDLEKVFVVEEH